MHIFQLVADALIPLLGYFLWDWSIYFIVLFYLIDLLSGEILAHFKAKKINQHQQGRDLKTWLKYGFLSFFFFVVTLFSIHLVILQIYPGIDFQTEIASFWNYEDMGIKQGYVLIPLLFLVAFQRYKLEFLGPQKYRTLVLPVLWKNHIRTYLPLIAGVGICAGLVNFVTIPDILLLIGILLLTSLYRWRVRV